MLARRVLGGRRQDSLVYIDGTLFTHGDGGTTFKASTDALQEFDIKAGLYSSEYGIRPGAQIVAVTKSGSNDFHGSLSGFTETTISMPATSSSRTKRSSNAIS